MYNIIVTSGGTEEKIDEVRKITNNATGKLGSIIAEKLVEKNNVKVFYVCSKTAVRPKDDGNIEVIETEGVNGLKETIEKLLKKNNIDFFIHTMAVSDYILDFVESDGRVLDTSKKISSDEESLVIHLKRAPKVISCIKEISPNTRLIGFKLLNQVSEEELIKVSQNLLHKNKCDLVIGNDSKSFVNGRHEAIFVTNDGVIERAERKEEIAEKLVKYLNLK